jgi:DNA replication protein DnaC
VVNKRYIDNKPIIFTSNYSLKELIENRGMADKTIDRIVEMCEVMKLEGQSYRMTAMREREKLF